MLFVLIIWGFMVVTTFCLGIGFSAFCEKVLKYRIKKIRNLMFAGIVLATVYAEAVSFIGRVNVEADLILCAGCLILAFFLRGDIKERMREVFPGNNMQAVDGQDGKRVQAIFRKKGIAKGLFCVFLFILWAFFTSRGYCVYDMNLYHGQSIRWIEEVGVAKGMGHINGRFAYNSSVFALSALYDFHLLQGKTVHAVNGFLAFLMSLEAVELGACFRRKRMLLSDYARAALVYYLSLIWDEITAPSSDYAVMLTIFFTVINWLSCLEEEKEQDQKNITPYCLLCVVSVFALSLKLSAGLLILLLIKPAARLLREKRWKEIAMYLSMGILVAAPWMARTYVISGWLFYPFTALDLFNPVWKMRNVQLIDMDAKLIEAWARGTRALGVDIPVSVWFFPWLKNELHFFERLIVIGDLVACLFVVGKGILVLVKKQWERVDELLVLTTLVACYLFWQFSAPMLRYGYAYVLLLLAVAGGSFVEMLFREKGIGLRLVYLGLLFFGCYRLWAGVTYVWKSLPEPYYLEQVDYEMPEGQEEYLLGDMKFYVLPEGELAGYHLFPVYSARPGEVVPLGKRLKDGFRAP